MYGSTSGDRTEQGSSEGLSAKVFALWFFPWFLAGLSLVICWFVLDFATYSYIHRADKTELPDVGFNFFDTPTEIVSISKFDAISLLLPVAFTAVAVLRRDLALWARTMFCHVLLQLLKGICSSLTVMPDAVGWQRCQARLGAEFVDWLSHSRSKMEIVAYGLQRLHGKQLRFCADMMYSGHTFFVVLYALALYEAIGRALDGQPRIIRLPVLATIFVFATVYLAAEIVLMLKYRIHYSSDLLVSVVLTILLFFSSSAVRAGDCWAQLGCSEAAGSAAAVPLREGSHWSELGYESKGGTSATKAAKDLSDAA